MTRRIGFVGMGNVGLPMALHLVQRGFDVYGFDVRPNPQFSESGGKMVASLEEIARCGTIIHSLPTVAALSATVDGLLPGLSGGETIIDLSSYPLEDKLAQATRLHQAGATMLDCEVSGLPVQVINRSAVLFKAGDADIVSAHQDVFDAIADRHFYLGNFGAATKMKLIANMMVCVNDLVAAEALNLGRAAGLDVAQMIAVLGPSAAGSTTFMNKAPLMLSREFGAGRGPFSHMFGYLTRARALADTSGTGNAMPLLDATRRIFAIAESEKRHDQDIAAIIEVVEAMNDRAA
jgi:3-hydroxyisobutyrate dehydrogenase-like beta-hydroxyacid dehydrogenase